MYISSTMFSLVNTNWHYC